MRSEDELRRHIDYIHYNPVKHGYVDSPLAWSHSSIHEFIRGGQNNDDGIDEIKDAEGADFGE